MEQPALAPTASADAPRQGKTTIRPCTRHDIDAVADLFERVYPGAGPEPAARADHLREVLFENPWRDPLVPSWVAEESGRAVGFQGTIARPMNFKGRALRVATVCQFLVDPERRRSLIALQLIKACLSGVQDLTLADGANDLSARLWLGLGGKACLLHSLHWTRPLRPARHSLSLLQRRARTLAPFAWAGRPVAAALDAAFARVHPNRFHRADPAALTQPLDTEAVLAQAPDAFTSSEMHPVYQAQSWRWLIDQAARKTRHGALRARMVSVQGGVVGWFLYYVERGGVAEVLQCAARPGHWPTVLRSLFADAWGQGAVTAHGRLDPGALQVSSEHHCWLRREGPWTLAHARDPELLACLHRGDAMISRLEGEWWLRVVGG